MTGTSVDGPRTPDEVWERYARPELWCQWAPQIRGVEADVDRMVAGTRGRVLSWGGVGADFVSTRGTTTCAGSQAWLVVRGPAALVFGYLLPARLALY